MRENRVDYRLATQLRRQKRKAYELSTCIKANCKRRKERVFLSVMEIDFVVIFFSILLHL